jgi:hypothetical protein
MDTDISLRFPALTKAYKMYGAGSVLGMAIHKVSAAGAPAGTLTVRPLVNSAGAGFVSAPNNPITGSPTLSLAAATELNKKAEFGVGVHPFVEMGVIGIEITSSADYVGGTRPEIIVELFVEI